MTANSDLDLIVVYDFDPERPDSDGARPLHAAQYFARFTQRLINALTTPTNYGRLYDVDMRLRPSGRSGPVATSTPAFRRAISATTAWTWEHMALDPRPGGVVDAGFRGAGRGGDPRRACARRATPRRSRPRSWRCAGRSRPRRATAARWDLKNVAGGLVDLEFIAQYLQLVHAHAVPEILDTATAGVFEKAARLGLLAAEDAEVLRPCGQALSGPRPNPAPVRCRAVRSEVCRRRA